MVWRSGKHLRRGLRRQNCDLGPADIRTNRTETSTAYRLASTLGDRLTESTGTGSAPNLAHGSMLPTSSGTFHNFQSSSQNVRICDLAASEAG